MNMRYQILPEVEKSCVGDRKTTKFLCLPHNGC